MGTGLFRSLHLNEEAILFLVLEHFAMHSTPCIAYAKPDSDTLGNFMGKEGVEHVSGTHLLQGNHLKIRTILSEQP